MAKACFVAALITVLVLAPQARADAALTVLIDAVAERLQIAEPVAAYKWSTHTPIEDPARVEQELATLRADAEALQIDPDYPDYVATIFRDQVGATEAIEYSRFAQWKLDTAGAPPPPQDLSASRAQIDTLNTKILSQASLNWSLLRSPSCGFRLDEARTVVIRARRFDDLYQRALNAATRSYCQGQSAA
ncbi:chorismate mutase [Mycobacterium asiaticum]|uniref:Chorismate mutase n=1 Tax=Mycobacterium asiaticum TaxID=1790 RepID=A0A1A3D001_MYCAS|nr:chorismate mutase [Mycobacterium asiaticum]OBI92370.1 chorismate mutase [Mycobacterium asiaticum]